MSIVKNNKCLYCLELKETLNKTICNKNHYLCIDCIGKCSNKCIICFPYFCNICNEFYKYENMKNEFCVLQKNKHYICDTCNERSLGICMLCSPLETTSVVIAQKQTILDSIKEHYVSSTQARFGKFNCDNCSADNYKYNFEVTYKILNDKIEFLIYPIYNFIETSEYYFCLDCDKRYCLYCADIISKYNTIPTSILKCLKNKVICDNCSTDVLTIKNNSDMDLQYIIDNVTQCYYCYEYRFSYDIDIVNRRTTNHIQLTLKDACSFCNKINKKRGLCICKNICMYNRMFCKICSVKYCRIDRCNELIQRDTFCQHHLYLKCSKMNCTNLKIENILNHTYNNNFDYCLEHTKKCSERLCSNISAYNTEYCMKCISKKTSQVIYLVECVRCKFRIKSNPNYKGSNILCSDCRKHGKDLSINK